MRAKYIIEAANHPTDPDADEVYYIYLACCLNSSMSYSYPPHTLLNFSDADTVKEGSDYSSRHICKCWRRDCELLRMGSGTCLNSAFKLNFIERFIIHSFLC